MNTKIKPTTAADAPEAPRKLAAGFDAIDANLESPAEKKINADSTLYPHILGADSQKACDEFTYGKSQGKPEAPRETTFCPKCQMNVMNTRIEHHQTWCNKELSISTQSALAIDALTRSLGAAAKPAHTPGPWKIDENEELPLAVIQDNEDGEGVCEIGKPDSSAYAATPEEWANARLISAAPELLAALKALADASATVGNLDHAGAHVPADAWADMYAANNAARAAIAAAEGSAQ